MTAMRRWWLLVVAGLTMLPAVLTAQPRALSLWLGAGRPVAKDSVSFALSNLDAYGALQLDLPTLPFSLRADVSVAGGAFGNGTRNVTTSAIFPLRLPVIQPYAMIGYGTYDWGKAEEARGVSYGAGVRVQLGGLGVFGQVRRHERLDRAIGTLGVVF